MKYAVCETIEQYKALNARIEAALGLPNQYFQHYAAEPTSMNGKYYMPIIERALQVLTENDIEALVNELPKIQEETC